MPSAPPDSALADGMRAALAHHWHPVCTADELPGPVGVQLLGRELAVAQLADGRLLACTDRCAHRSTRLSIGCVDRDRLRCAYHGWAYGVDGRCVEIPSMPESPIPIAAAVETFEARIEHGLVWIRLESTVDTAVPACPGLEDPAMKMLAGEPYTWPVSALRRVENFVDLAHFAWVHDGSLGRRDKPVPPLPELHRHGGELRFAYDPPGVPDQPDPTALIGASSYRMPMPCTVDIEFILDGGHRRRLWMTASPIDDRTCRCFWYVGRTDDLAGDDRDHLDFQALVLDEDEPVVTNQIPRELPLEQGIELSVRTDRVSITYRRWLRELAVAALDGPTAYAEAIGLDVPRSPDVQSASGKAAS
jgi:phenylpropionate dioxygenase-like ring-hydroxylating dioxygenase large terminal subunit